MTETDWLNSTDPMHMLEFLKGKASDRKQRLFAVACCRRIWDIIVAEEQQWHKDEAAFWRRCQDAVVLAERFADGQATEQELAAVTAYPRPGLYDADAAMSAAEIPLYPSCVSAPAAEAAALAAQSRMYAEHFPSGYTPSPENEALIEEEDKEYGRVLALEEKCQCGLLHCIFGDPFHPMTVDLTWHTPAVVQLAQAIYDERAFDRVPELADALEEAGCPHAGIVSHCRHTSEHVRGCWAVDLLLGKE